MGKCTPSKCRRLDAMSLSVLSVTGIARRYRTGFSSGPPNVGQKAVVSASHGSGGELRSEVY